MLECVQGLLEGYYSLAFENFLEYKLLKQNLKLNRFEFSDKRIYYLPLFESSLLNSLAPDNCVLC